MLSKKVERFRQGVGCRQHLSHRGDQIDQNVAVVRSIFLKPPVSGNCIRVDAAHHEQQEEVCIDNVSTRGYPRSVDISSEPDDGGGELEPPARIPHAVYVKTLYRTGGQDYCRHHVIRAAVAAGLVTEVRPGPGPVASTNRGVSPMEYDRPFPE